MKKVQKPAKKAKKAYAAPKLTTHGDVAKLTQHKDMPIGPIMPGSNLFQWPVR
jgi:hypothetical protein